MINIWIFCILTYCMRFKWASLRKCDALLIAKTHTQARRRARTHDTHTREIMADQEGKGKAEGEFARRIDPAKENLTREQLQFIRQAELAQWRKKSQKLRARNVITGLAIGALVMGICILNYQCTRLLRLVH